MIAGTVITAIIIIKDTGTADAIIVAVLSIM